MSAWWNPAAEFFHKADLLQIWDGGSKCQLENATGFILCFMWKWKTQSGKRGSKNTDQSSRSEVGLTLNLSFLPEKPTEEFYRIIFKGLSAANLDKEACDNHKYLSTAAICDEISATCCLLSPLPPLFSDAHLMKSAALISFPGPALPTLPGPRLQVHREGQQGEWWRAGHQLAKCVWEYVCVCVCVAPQW